MSLPRPASLSPSSRQYQGRLLCYRPNGGCGWWHVDASGRPDYFDHRPLVETGAFRIRVRRIFTFRGELRGIVGKVEQPGHPFDGWWAVTYLMCAGEWSLTDNLCPRWDIRLGEAEPIDEDWPEAGGAGKEVWPEIPSPLVTGDGVLSVPNRGATVGGTEGKAETSSPDHT